MKHYTLLLLFSSLVVFGQKEASVEDYAATITAKELKEHLYVYASDYFQGRETGTIGQKRAVDYIQNFYTTAGIKAAEGTTNYLQAMELKSKKI